MTEGTEYLSANQANWDERVDIHWGSAEYNVQRYIEDPEAISGEVSFDQTEIGEVAGKRLLHLQCHIGTDTLSWARLGATVTGVDFSPKAIDAARRLSRESGTPGRFVVSELYDSPSQLKEEFDIVYTGVGAICWLPDIDGWAQVVSTFLKPGGTFYMREGHPIMWGLDWDEENLLSIVEPYLGGTGPIGYEDDTTYAGEGKMKNTVRYNFKHGLGEIVTALIDAGLRIEFLREHQFCDWQGIPHLRKGDDRWWRLPDQPERLPLMYSVRAVKS